jgi:hypothetical protein
MRVDELAELTGFTMGTKNCRLLPEPSLEELDVLRGVVDPMGLTRLEAPDDRRPVLRDLAALWAQGGGST